MSTARKQTTLSQAMSKAIEQKGPSNSIQASKARRGKDSVPAGKAPEMGLGVKLWHVAMKAESTVRENLLAIIDHPKADIAQAIIEVQAERDKAKEEIRASYGQVPAEGQKKLTMTSTAKFQMTRQLSSVAATASRILTILDAMHKDRAIEQIRNASGLVQMYGFAVLKRKPKKAAVVTQLGATQFENLDAKVDQVVLTDKGKEPDNAALARLETLFRHTLSALAKYKHRTTVPVDKIMPLIEAPKKIRRVANG